MPGGSVSLKTPQLRHRINQQTNSPKDSDEMETQMKKEELTPPY